MKTTKRNKGGAVVSKDCTRCSTHKPASAFGPDKRNKSGLGSWCKRCIAQKLTEKRRSLAGNERKAYNRKQAEKNKRWRADNPEKARVLGKSQQATYRAKHKKRTLDRSHAAYHFRWLFDLFDHCMACGGTDNLTIDHAIPLGRGRNHPANLQVLCRECNSSKQGSETDYRTRGDMEKILAAMDARSKPSLGAGRGG